MKQIVSTDVCASRFARYMRGSALANVILRSVTVGMWDRLSFDIQEIGHDGTVSGDMVCEMVMK